VVKDATGLVRLEMGNVTGGTTYGINVFDSAGAKVLAVSNNGLLLPGVSLTPRDANANVAETQVSLNVSEYWAGVPVVSANAVTASLPWSTDAGTTAVIRLVLKAAPNTGAAVVAATNQVALAANSNGSQVFNWLHQQAKGSGPWYFGVQAAVTGGGGAVHVYVPVVHHDDRERAGRRHEHGPLAVRRSNSEGVLSGHGVSHNERRSGILFG
jgi:hypothetical protein